MRVNFKNNYQCIVRLNKHSKYLTVHTQNTLHSRKTREQRRTLQQETSTRSRKNQRKPRATKRQNGSHDRTPKTWTKRRCSTTHGRTLGRNDFTFNAGSPEKNGDDIMQVWTRYSGRSLRADKSCPSCRERILKSACNYGAFEEGKKRKKSLLLRR